MDMAKLPVTFPFELPVAVNTTLWPVEEGKHDGAGTKLKLATFTAVPLPWVRFIENAKAGDPSGLFRPAPQNPLMFHVWRELPHAPNISTSPDKTATRICFIAGFRLQTAIFYAGAGASSKRKRLLVMAQFDFHRRTTTATKVPGIAYKTALLTPISSHPSRPINNDAVSRSTLGALPTEVPKSLPAGQSATDSLIAKCNHQSSSIKQRRAPRDEDQSTFG
jgi:hypothetical protein